MPQIQKRKCSVNFGELISFLSITEEYSLASLNYMLNYIRTPEGTRRTTLAGNQKKRVTPSSKTSTLSLTPAFSASRSSNWSGSSMGSCDRRKVP